MYRRSIATLSAWDGIDALIVIFIRPLLTRAEEVAGAVRTALGEMERRIPVQAVFMSSGDRGRWRLVAASPPTSIPRTPRGRWAGR